MSEFNAPPPRGIAPTDQRDGMGLIRRARAFVVPAALVLIWESVASAGWVSPQMLPSPGELLGTLASLVDNGTLLAHAGISSLRVLIGFIIGTGLAVAIGGAVGLSRRTEALLDPSLQALRAIPALAWVPLLLMWLGTDEAPKLALIALGAFFPVYLEFVAGIRNVDRKLVEIGGIHGLTGCRLVCRAFLPAALPQLFAGLRMSLSLSWMFLVAAELTGTTRGLGRLLAEGREGSRADLVIVAIVTLAVLGKTSDSLLRWLASRLLDWRDVVDTRPL